MGLCKLCMPNVSLHVFLIYILIQNLTLETILMLIFFFLCTSSENVFYIFYRTLVLSALLQLTIPNQPHYFVRYTVEM